MIHGYHQALQRNEAGKRAGEVLPCIGNSWGSAGSLGCNCRWKNILFSIFIFRGWVCTHVNLCHVCDLTPSGLWEPWKHVLWVSLSLSHIVTASSFTEIKTKEGGFSLPQVQIPSVDHGKSLWVWKMYQGYSKQRDLIPLSQGLSPSSAVRVPSGFSGLQKLYVFSWVDGYHLASV